MLVSMFPRVTGMKIEDSWERGSTGMVRCTARLTRALRKDESNRVNRLLRTSTDGTQVVHECRPEDVEEWHKRLVEALSGAWVPAAAPVAARGGDGRARSRRGHGGRPRRRDQ